MMFGGDPRFAWMIGFMHAYKLIVPDITYHTNFLIRSEERYFPPSGLGLCIGLI